MRQVDTLTGVRGAAALWVALHHICGEYLTDQSGLNVLRNVAAKGWLGVDLFFVLSGFVISYVYASQMQAWDWARTRRFLRLRIARVYPAHLATTLLLMPLYVVGVALFRYRPPHDDFSLLKLVYSLTLLNGWGIPDSIGWNNVSWSVSSEWFAYLTFPVLTLAVGRVKPVWVNVLLVTSVFVVTFGLALLVNAGEKYMLDQQYTLWRVSSEFLIGCLAYNIFRALPSNRDLDAAIWLTLTAIVGLGAIRVAAVADVLFIVLFVVLVLSLSHAGRFGSATFGSRPAVYLGEISYSIYLIHPTLLIFIARLTRHFAPEPSTVGLLVIFAGYLVATIASAHAVYHFVEEPARAYLRRRWASASAGGGT